MVESLIDFYIYGLCFCIRTNSQLTAIDKSLTMRSDLLLLWSTGVPIIDPLIIFLVTGVVSMSAALSAGALNKLSEEEKPPFASTRNGMVTIVMLGNIAALTLVFSAAYGFINLEWWIALLCVFISFPVVHVIVIQQMFGEFKALMLTSPLVILSIPVLYLYW